MHEAATVGATFAQRFRIIEAIAEGEMGALVMAERRESDERVALKVVRPDIIEDAELLARFASEVRPGTESEHVVAVLEAAVDPETGCPWIAMELLEGEDLSAALAREQHFSPPELRLVMGQLCDALAETHERGLAHGGLTPENVFLSQSPDAANPGGYRVKVRELGFARFFIAAFAREGELVGTPAWMAPEQLKIGTVAAPPTDVWTLGLLAFWMLTGRSYWRRASDPTAPLKQQLRELVVEPLATPSERAAELGLEVPEWFDVWFSRCVSRAPSDRFANASAVIAALDAALDDEEHSGPPVASLERPIATDDEDAALAGATPTPSAPGAPPSSSVDSLPRVSTALEDLDDELEEVTRMWRSPESTSSPTRSLSEPEILTEELGNSDELEPPSAPDDAILPVTADDAAKLEASAIVEPGHERARKNRKPAERDRRPSDPSPAARPLQRTAKKERRPKQEARARAIQAPETSEKPGRSWMFIAAIAVVVVLWYWLTQSR